MPIEVTCECGAPLLLSIASKTTRCSRCKTVKETRDLVPRGGASLGRRPAAAPEGHSDDAPSRPEPGRATAAPRGGGASARPRPRAAESGASRHYLLLGLCLIPLAFVLIRPPSTLSIEDRLDATVAGLPEEQAIEVWEAIDAAADDKALLRALPGDRLVGASFGVDSRAHWALAGVSVVFFAGLIAFFPRKDVSGKSLVLVALFTGTAGIALLLGLQKLVFGLRMGGLLFLKGPLIIFFLVLKFIAFSYNVVMTGSESFFLTFFGYTFGVGLCEEIIKALPIIWRIRKAELGDELDPRDALHWGLASGAGFGIAEGIHYASEMYNGIEAFSIYPVRFFSCVALHAMWTAAASVQLARRADEVRSFTGFVGTLLGWIDRKSVV